MNCRINTIVWEICAIALLWLLLWTSGALAADYTVAWDANTEPDLAGYRLYYGVGSGNYTDSVDVGNVTQHTVADLADDTIYYFALRAYDTDGNYSELSEEINTDAPSAPGGVRIEVNVTVTITP